MSTSEQKGLQTINAITTTGAVVLAASGPSGVAVAAGLTAFTALQPILGLGGGPPEFGKIIAAAMRALQEWARDYVDQAIVTQFVAEREAKLRGFAEVYDRVGKTTGETKWQAAEGLANDMDAERHLYTGTGKAKKKDTLPLYPLWASLHLSVLREVYNYSVMHDKGNERANLERLRQRAKEYREHVLEAVAQALLWRLGRIETDYDRSRPHITYGAWVEDDVTRQHLTGKIYSMDKLHREITRLRHEQAKKSFRHWYTAAIQPSYAWYGDQWTSQLAVKDRDKGWWPSVTGDSKQWEHDDKNVAPIILNCKLFQTEVSYRTPHGQESEHVSGSPVKALAKINANRSVMSDPLPLPGQLHRSSKNFSTKSHSGNKIRWSCEDGVTFDVKKDVRFGRDPTILSRVGNGSYTDMVHDSSLYVANPRGAVSKFAVEFNGVAG